MLLWPALGYWIKLFFHNKQTFFPSIHRSNTLGHRWNTVKHSCLKVNPVLSQRQKQPKIFPRSCHWNSSLCVCVVGGSWRTWRNSTVTSRVHVIIPHRYTNTPGLEYVSVYPNPQLPCSEATAHVICTTGWFWQHWVDYHGYISLVSFKQLDIRELLLKTLHRKLGSSVSIQSLSRFPCCSPSLASAYAKSCWMYLTLKNGWV